MPVSNTKKAYDTFAPKWKRARDVIAGSDEVKAAGETYLPKLKAQTTDQYKGYVMRATFYNAAYRVVAAMLGMLFRKPPTQDIPSGLDKLLENINLQGDNLLSFANKLSYELDVVGRVGILVDHTRRPEGYETLTRAVAEQIGFRATIQLYPAESIINWRTRVVNNKTLLCLVVLQEEVVVPDPKDKFKETTKKRYRVLELDESNYYTVTVYELGDDRKDKIVEPTFHPLMDNSPFTEIPFYIAGPSGLAIEPEEPPMIDLIDLNLAHYRVSATYEHGCHFTGLPTPYVAGANIATENDGKTPVQFYVGSETIMIFADPNAKMDYGEFSGQGLSELSKNLDRKESQMAILGARMLAPEKKTAETATTAAIHRTGENAILSSVAVTSSEALSKALTLFAKWSGVDKECKYDLNRDFMPFNLDAPFLLALVQAYLQGTLPYESFFEILQRGDLVNGEMTVEEAMKAIEADKQKRATQAADAAGQIADATGAPADGGPQGGGKKPPTKA